MAPPKAPAKPKTVAEYIAAVDRPARDRLEEMRTLIRVAAPEAVESLKWGMPAHSYKWIVMMYAALQKHVSLVSGTPAIRAFKKELATPPARPRVFPLDRPVPA